MDFTNHDSAAKWNYYASQTENGCESTTRLAVTIELINTLPASNYEELLCDDLNDGTETVNLNNYESNIISSNPNYMLSIIPL
jgi:hypothetical protein